MRHLFVCGLVLARMTESVSEFITVQGGGDKQAPKLRRPRVDGLRDKEG